MLNLILFIIVILSFYLLYKSFNKIENFRNNVMADDFIFELTSIKPKNFPKNVRLLHPDKNNIVTLNSPMIAVSYYYIRIPRGKIFNSWGILNNNNKSDGSFLQILNNKGRRLKIGNNKESTIVILKFGRENPPNNYNYSRLHLSYQ